MTPQEVSDVISECMEPVMYFDLCPICKATRKEGYIKDPLIQWPDMYETESYCKRCNLYTSCDRFGTNEEVIGFVTFLVNFSYGVIHDSGTLDYKATNHQDRPTALDEARRMYSDYNSEVQAFVASMNRNPEDDLPRLVFADWLLEKNLTLNEQTIRKELADANRDTG